MLPLSQGAWRKELEHVMSSSGPSTPPPKLEESEHSASTEEENMGGPCGNLKTQLVYPQEFSFISFPGILNTRRQLRQVATGWQCGLISLSVFSSSPALT